MPPSVPEQSMCPKYYAHILQGMHVPDWFQNSADKGYKEE